MAALLHVTICPMAAKEVLGAEQKLTETDCLSQILGSTNWAGGPGFRQWPEVSDFVAC